MSYERDCLCWPGSGEITPSCPVHGTPKVRHSIYLNFPLNDGFIAQFVLPRDLRENEKDRLIECIRTLVIPQPVTG